jgi:hypothetical protein
MSPSDTTIPKETIMSKATLLSVGDKIATTKYGNWTVESIPNNGYIVLVKYRRGVVTERFIMLENRLFS